MVLFGLFALLWVARRAWVSLLMVLMISAFWGLLLGRLRSWQSRLAMLFFVAGAAAGNGCSQATRKEATNDKNPMNCVLGMSKATKWVDVLRGKKRLQAKF